jgi:addiction module HigA family antidote
MNEDGLRMKNPPHPGRIVRQECLEPFGLSVAEAAQALGVTRQALNNVISGKTSITPEMAVRLAKAVGNDPDFWLRLQRQYDIAQVLKARPGIKVKRFRRKAQDPARPQTLE